MKTKQKKAVKKPAQKKQLQKSEVKKRNRIRFELSFESEAQKQLFLKKRKAIFARLK